MKCTGTVPACSSCTRHSHPCSYEPVTENEKRNAKERQASRRRSKAVATADDHLLCQKQRLSLEGFGASFFLESRQE
jgi:hypothetical protein